MKKPIEELSLGTVFWLMARGIYPDHPKESDIEEYYEFIDENEEK